MPIRFNEFGVSYWEWDKPEKKKMSDKKMCCCGWMLLEYQTHSPEDKLAIEILKKKNENCYECNYYKMPAKVLELEKAIESLKKVYAAKEELKVGDKVKVEFEGTVSVIGEELTENENGVRLSFDELDIPKKNMLGDCFGWYHKRDVKKINNQQDERGRE